MSGKRLTEREILPDLIAVVKMFGEVSYLQATKTLIKRGVWGENDVPTPAATINAYLTTSRDESGRLIFERVSDGHYRIAPKYW